MSSIQLPAILNNKKIATYERADGADTVSLQTMSIGNPFTDTLGTVTANGQSVSATDLNDVAAVFFTIKGTYSATFAFEASDDSGVTWFAIQGVRSDSNTGETTSGALSSTARAWRANISGFSGFRVRCSAFTSGTATIRISKSPFAIESVPFIPTHAVTQSGTWSIAQSGNWALRNNIFFNETTTALAASATFTGTSRDGGTAAAAVALYSSFNATVFADQSGTVRLEMSNDNTTWRRCTADVAVTAAAPVSLSVPVATRYYRAVYVNGATLQGAFMLNTSYTAA